MPADSLSERDFDPWTQDRAKRLHQPTGHDRPDAVRRANKQLAAHGDAPVAARVPSSLGLGDVLSADFDADAAVDAVAHAVTERRV